MIDRFGSQSVAKEAGQVPLQQVAAVILLAGCEL
jgi:hypothetical protein